MSAVLHFRLRHGCQSLPAVPIDTPHPPPTPRHRRRHHFRQVTGPLLKVLRAFLADPTAELYGLQVLRATGLKSGTLYPLLDRLEGAGWVRSRWEDTEPAEQGRPRRRFYTLTGIGHHEARHILLEHGVEGLQWT